MTIKYPSEWEDLSNFLVHFTKQEEDGDDYNKIMSILGNRKLKALNPFGIAKSKGREDQNVTCFSEIPPGYWKRIIKRRKTKFGIAFHRRFILERGGIPVWYLCNQSNAYNSVIDLINNADNDNPIWNITPFIDAPGLYGNSRYEFEWEREWRIAGDLCFLENNVAFLLIPEEKHSAALSFFSDVYDKNEGPAYFCPYIDPKWSRKKILETLIKGTQKKKVSKEVRSKEIVIITETGKSSRKIIHTKYL